MPILWQPALRRLGQVLGLQQNGLNLLNPRSRTRNDLRPPTSVKRQGDAQCGLVLPSNRRVWPVPEAQKLGQSKKNNLKTLP
jgi:hypothetical protein